MSTGRPQSDREAAGLGSLSRLLWALLLLVPAIPLFPALSGRVLGPFDQILSMAPWNGPKPSGAWDILQADGVLQSFAWRALVLQGWHGGDLPFWNPHQLLGAPLLANSQSGGFYPPHILLGLLGASPEAATGILAWLHLSVMGLGVFFLARRWGAGVPGALLGGSAASVSPFLMAWLPLASAPATCCWIPWCVLGASSCFRGARPLLSGAGLALAVAMMILAGHLQFAFYGILACLAAAVVEFIFALREGRLGWTALAAAIGLAMGPCLAAPQLMPVLENSKFSHRAGRATQAGYESYVKGGLSWWELPGLVFPSAMGFPGAVSPALAADKAPSFWPAFVRPGAAAAESAWGVGPLVFGLAALSLARKRRRASEGDGEGPAKGQGERTAGLIVCGALALGSLLLALGTPLNALLYFGFPGFSATGSPGRAIVLLVVAAAVSVALLWPDSAEDWPDGLKAGLGGLGAAFILALGLFQAALPGLSSWAQGLNIQAIASAQLQAGLLWAAGSLLAGALALWAALNGRPWLGAALGLSSQVLLGSAFWIPFGDPGPKGFQEAFRAPLAGLAGQRAAFVNRSWGFLQTPKALAPPNTASLAGINDIGGYDSLLHRDTAALLNGINGRDSAPETNGNIMHVKPSADLSKLAEAGVTVLVLPEGSPEPSGLKPGPVPSSWLLPGRGRAFMSNGGEVELVDGLSRQDLLVEGPGVLTVVDWRRPGWEAYVDGARAQWAPGPWRSVAVQAGAHKVQFRYTPPGLQGGLFLLLSGILFTALMAVAGFLVPRKPAVQEAARAEVPADSAP